MNAENLDLGPCELKVNSTDVGILLGDVTVNLEEDFSDLRGAQFGKTVLNKIRAGKTVEIEAELAETTMENFATAIGGTVEGSGTTKHVKILNAVGDDLLSDAVPVQLTRWVNGGPSTDPTDVLLFPLSGILSKTQIVFSPDKQKAYKIQIHVFPNTTTGEFGRLGTGV